MNTTPIEHTEHRTDRDPLQGSGPAYARFGPRRATDRADTVDVPWSHADGLGEE